MCILYLPQEGTSRIVWLEVTSVVAFAEEAAQEIKMVHTRKLKLQATFLNHMRSDHQRAS